MMLEAPSENGLLRRLYGDGFVRIGTFRIEELSRLVCTIESNHAADWLNSIYCFFSGLNGGTVLRIGKSKSRLAGRIRSYAYYINAALSGELASNEKWKGGTPPWEGRGWVDLTDPSGCNMLLAKQVQVTDGSLSQLTVIERKHICDYDPPLCNDSRSGRERRRIWVANNGRLIVKLRRDSVANPLQKDVLF